MEILLATGNVKKRAEFEHMFAPLGVTLLVAVNAAIALWRGNRELEWSSTFTRFLALSVVNLGLLGIYSWLVGDDDFNVAGGLFFAMLLTLIIVLFDRYRRIRSARFAAMGQADDANPIVGLMEESTARS